MYIKTFPLIYLNTKSEYVCESVLNVGTRTPCTFYIKLLRLICKTVQHWNSKKSTYDHPALEFRESHCPEIVQP